MAKYTFTIDGQTFNSKKAVLDHVKSEIHSKYQDYHDLSESHLRFMCDLLHHHPWSDQKIGCGISRMWIQPNGDYGTRGFWLGRLDGTQTDFSFYQCVEPASMERDFREACRRAIAPVVIEFRHQHFENAVDGKIRCPIDRTMVAIHESHVDHEPPNTFETIAKAFVEEHKIDVATAPISDHVDGTIGNVFTDETLERQWLEFHNARAPLRVISASANLKMPAKGFA